MRRGEEWAPPGRRGLENVMSAGLSPIYPPRLAPHDRDFRALLERGANPPASRFPQ